MGELENYLAQFQQELYYYLFRRIRNKEDCEDLLQEVYLKAFLAFPSQKILNVGAWLKTIARHTMIDYYRTQKRIEYLSEEVEQTLPILETLEIYSELNEVLESIANLPLIYRNALILVTVKGFSYEEASEILGIPVSTLKSHVKRGREKLHSLLKEEGENNG